MAFQFPDFSNAYLDRMSICARIESSDEVDESFWPEEDAYENLEAFLKSDGHEILVRLILNRQVEPAGLHFHIDLIRREVLDEVPKAKSSVKVKKIRERIQQFVGSELFVRSVVRFGVPQSELPEDGVILLMSDLSVGPPDSDIKLISSTFRIGEPESRLTWSLEDDEGDESEMVSVTIEGRETYKLSEDLLVLLSESAVLAFESYILEQTDGEVEHE